MQNGPAAQHAGAAAVRTEAPATHRACAAEPVIELAVIVPTFEERDNVAPLIERLELALEPIAWEVVFVDDDSPDGTADAVRAIARCDRRVRIVQRLGRRGLAGACIEGVLSSAAPFVAVMDADLQHDAALLPRMLMMLRGEPLDVVVGSRYSAGGSIGQWSRGRRFLSRLGMRGSQLLLGQQQLHDPLSGFFMLRREVLEACAHRLSRHGFKVLLDILASSARPLRLAELPYRFAPRTRGSSKLDATVAWHFAMLVLEKLARRAVPVRFLLFSAVGLSGVAVQLLALGLLVRALPFAVAQASAVVLAMSSNFFLNNAITYRDQRLRGYRLWRGLASFYLICGLGALANVGIGTLLYAGGELWWLAGLASAIVGAAWNYGATRLYTWQGLSR